METLDVFKGLGIFIAVLVMIFFVFFGWFFTVQPGERAMVYSWNGGLKSATYGEGFHLKVPIIEQAITMNIRIQKQEEQASAASKDLQDVSTTVAVNFKIDPEKIHEIYRTVGQATPNEDYMQSEIMNPIILESVKQVTAKYTAEQLITNRAEAKAEIDRVIVTRMEQYNIIVTDVSLTDFKFSKSFTDAIEAKVSAEQNAMREEKNIALSEALAQQKIKQAQGDAEAIRIVNEQLTRSPQYINFLLVSKWDGKMPMALGSGSLISIVPQTGDVEW